MISRSKRIILIAAVVLVVAVASFAWVTRRNTEKRLTALRGAGMPVTAVDLDSWYKHVPADENQALVVLEAWKLAHTDPAIEPREKLPGPGEPVPEEQNSAISDYLSMNQAALQKLFSLNGSGPSRYPIDLSFGPETLLPHLAHVKSLALLLNFSVLDRCEADDSKGALRSVLTGFTLARTLRDEPILISELVRAACITITLSGAERLLTRFELTDDELLLLDGALRMAESDGRRALPRVLAGERAGGIGIFSLPYSQIEKYGVTPTDLGGGVSDIFKGVVFGTYNATGLREVDRAIYLDSIQDFLNASTNQFPALLTATEQAQRRMDERLRTGLGKYAVLSRMLLPSTVNVALKEAEVTARLRCAQTAIGIERFRNAHKRALPQSLSELVPEFMKELPADPYTGKPLEFTSRPEKGYTLKSSFRKAVNVRGRAGKEDAIAFTVAR